MKRRNDAGLKAMQRNMRELDKTIQAGIFSDKKASRSANGSRADNLAYRLKIHDQGLGNNPERKVLEPARIKFIEKLETILPSHLKKLDENGFSAASKLSALGLTFQAQIQVQMPRAKPNKKESTIRAAKSRYGTGRMTTTLIQTGEMRQAVTFKVV